MNRITSFAAADCEWDNVEPLTCRPALAIIDEASSPWRAQLVRSSRDELAASNHLDPESDGPFQTHGWVCGSHRSLWCSCCRRKSLRRCVMWSGGRPRYARRNPEKGDAVPSGASGRPDHLQQLKSDANDFVPGISAVQRLGQGSLEGSAERTQRAGESSVDGAADVRTGRRPGTDRTRVSARGDSGMLPDTSTHAPQTVWHRTGDHNTA